CLAYETPIVTKHGLVQIGEWAEKGEVQQVWDGKKWVRATATLTGEKAVVKLTLSNGMTLRMTGDHRIGTRDGGEVKAEDSVGESLDFMVPEHEDRGRINPRWVAIGFVQGDGNYHKASKRWKYVYLGEKDGDVAAYLKKYGVGIEPEGNRSDKYIIDKQSSDIFSVLMPVPLKDRYLTADIFGLDLGSMRSFLVGLYSANGTVLEKYGRISLKSVNRELVSGVQKLLTIFGIRTYVTVNQEHEVKFANGTYVCRESYDLNMTTEDARRFRENIGFIQEYKSEALNRMLENFKKGRRLPVVVLNVEDDGVEPVYDFKMEQTHWASASGFRVHNCGEISFEGWEDCNLGHINLERYAGNDEAAKEAFRLMTRFLVRATFGDVLNPYQKAVQDRNRRIGVGFFGFHPWLVYQEVSFSGCHHNKEIRNKLKAFRHACRDEARRYAFQLRIPEPIK